MLNIFTILNFRYTLITFVAFSCFNNYAQSINRRDSLLIEKLCKNAKDSISVNTTSALQLVNTVIELAEKNNYKIGLIRGYNVIGSIKQRESKYKQALLYFQKAIDIARAGNFENDLSMVLYNISGLYATMANYDKSFETNIEALNLKIKTKDTINIGRCYRQIAECLFSKGDLEQAITYANKAVAIQRISNKPKSLLRTLTSRAVILMEQKKLNQALNDLSEANAIANKIKDDSFLSSIYLHLGLCYDNLQKKDSAISYYSKSLVISSQTNNTLLQVVCLNNLGELYLKNKNFKLAEDFLLKGLPIAKNINSFIDIKDIYGNLAELYFVKSDYQKAYAYKELFEAYSDSLMNEQKMKAVEELSIRFETKEITEQNKLLQAQSKLDKVKVEQRNLFIYGSLIFMFLSTIIVFLYIKKRQQKNNHKNNELKQKLLLSQMNPHFIFNSVDNIQSLIYNNQYKEAINYLTKFSKLTRQILENSTQDYITLEEEVGMLDNYLKIQQLLFANKFNYHLIVDENIQQEMILIAPMLTQPFVENAIKHGLKNKIDGGVINVKFYFKNKVLFFEVTDNGYGIELKKNDNSHISLATQIVKDRLNIKSSKKTIEIIIENIYENNSVLGVRTLFEIPYIYNN
jgi:tetratricopeptide (TPR) repeat protein